MAKRRGGTLPPDPDPPAPPAAEAPPGPGREAPPELGAALALDGIDEEVAMLRALIRREYRRNEAGSVAELRRLVLALCGALRLRQSLAGQGGSSEGDARRLLDEALETVAAEQEAVATGQEAALRDESPERPVGEAAGVDTTAPATAGPGRTRRARAVRR